MVHQRPRIEQSNASEQEPIEITPNLMMRQNNSLLLQQRRPSRSYEIFRFRILRQQTLSICLVSVLALYIEPCLAWQSSYLSSRGRPTNRAAATAARITRNPSPFVTPQGVVLYQSAAVSAASPADETVNDDAGVDKNDGEEEQDEYTRTYHINRQLADLANQAARQRHRASRIGEQALTLFDTLREPDSVSYNSILKVLAKASPYKIRGVSAAQHALEKFAEMKQLHQEQSRANQLFYDQLEQDSMDPNEATTTIAQGPPLIRIKPNVRSYATLMDAFSRIGTAEAASLCEDLLHELEQRYHNNNRHVALEPNLITYNTVLSAWAKVGGSLGATRCLHLLQDMPIPPDRISYNAALHALARSTWPQAGERAQQMLQQDMPAAGVVPGARSYTTTMDAWGRSGRPDRAHALLEELTKLAQDDPSMTPNIVSYGTVLHAYAVAPLKTDEEDSENNKAWKAYRVFCSMQKAGLTPNRVAYNTMLNCCATSTTQHPELMELVESLYGQLVSSSSKDDGDTNNRKQSNSRNPKRRRNNKNNTNNDGPDHVTFATVLKACSNLLLRSHPPDREHDNHHPENFATTVFGHACERGYVSPAVLWQFRQAVPIDTYRDALGGNEKLAYHELPASWTRNAPEERGRRN